MMVGVCVCEMVELGKGVMVVIWSISETGIRLMQPMKSDLFLSINDNYFRRVRCLSAHSTILRSTNMPFRSLIAIK